jgi:hypothetical protein
MEKDRHTYVVSIDGQFRGMSACVFKDHKYIFNQSMNFPTTTFKKADTERIRVIDPFIKAFSHNITCELKIKRFSPKNIIVVIESSRGRRNSMLLAHMIVRMMDEFGDSSVRTIHPKTWKAQLRRGSMARLYKKAVSSITSKSSNPSSSNLSYKENKLVIEEMFDSLELDYSLPKGVFKHDLADSYFIGKCFIELQ